jgi:hypothetical protein
MFQWFREKAEQKIIQSHLSEMMPWLRQLTSISDEDVAPIYLSALAYRNILKRTTGVDLNKPEEAVEKRRMLAVELGGQIRDAQKSSLFVSANGLKVWLFTIRCVVHGELRPVGLAIWREMPRGFPFVHQLAREIYDQSGLQNDLTDFGQVPTGFEKP